jgi:hypothetical protein
MRKLFLILPVILLFNSKVFPQPEIAIDCPGSWGPGRYSKVIVKISFDRSEGFARFTQDLPVGFDLVKDEIPDGDFNWNGSQLTVVWMRIPASGKISFSYFIKPDNQMQGVIDFGGRVATVSGGSLKETSELKVRQISIGGTGGLLPEEIKRDITPRIVTNVTNKVAKSQNTASPGMSETVYRVQFATSSTEISGEEMKNKLGIVSNEKMTIIRSGEIFKYQLGEFRDKDSAVKLQKQLVSKGIKDAFVVNDR